MDLPLRDRGAILLALIGLSAISWLYIYLQMSPMDEMAMPIAFSPWTAADFTLNIAIWWVMMPGMMLPSAAPMILTFATVNRRKRTRGRPFVPTAVFTTGYLIAWGLFGIAATLADWGLEQTALMSPMTQRLSPAPGAAVIIVAGVYQLTASNMSASPTAVRPSILRSTTGTMAQSAHCAWGSSTGSTASAAAGF
jgi:hypothetical protein